MQAFMSTITPRSSPVKLNRRMKKASDLTIVSDSGYASSSNSTPLNNTKPLPLYPVPVPIPVRDSSAHRWSEVVPDSAALTFAAIWDPEEGIVAFTGAELLELSDSSYSSDSDQKSPTSPSTLSFPTLKDERGWHGYSTTTTTNTTTTTTTTNTPATTASHRALKKSRSSPLSLADTPANAAASRARRDTLSQLLNSFYFDVSGGGGGTLSQVQAQARSRRASIAASGSCLTRGGLACTILESDTVTISTLAYFRETHQRFFNCPPSPGLELGYSAPHALNMHRLHKDLDRNYPSQQVYDVSQTRTSSAILERSSNVPMFLRMKGSMLGKLQGYKTNRQFSCLGNLDDGFEFDPLRTVYARWGAEREDGKHGDVTDEGFCDGEEDGERTVTKRRRAVLFSNREDLATILPSHPAPGNDCSISITSWSALDMTDPFSTSQPKRLRKRRRDGAYTGTHSDTPVPPSEVLARAEAPLPADPSRPGYPQRTTSLYPRSVCDTPPRPRAQIRRKGSGEHELTLSRRPSLHRALTAPSESIGRFVRDLGPRLRKMSYMSRRESRMRKAGWRRKSEVGQLGRMGLDDERWVRIDVRRVGEGVVMS